MSRRAVGALSVMFWLACHPAVPPPAPVPAPVSAAPAPAVAPADVRPASAGELAAVKRLMAETERLRGLTFRHPVEVTIEGRQAMRAYVERTIDGELLARATQRYLALGAIDPSLDVRALLLAVMEEELVGYYDPKEKRLAVRADIARSLGTHSSSGLAWRATVVHELVHALQDQYFDLASKIEQVRSTDADDAFGALVEGDATLVMLAYTAEESGETLEHIVAQPDRILAALTRPRDQLTEALRNAPALLREPLLFRYREGALFCARLVRVGGWARVDGAQRSPPESTRVIRRPDDYLGGAREYALTLPPFADARWTQRDEDVLGALELGLLLRLEGAAAAQVLEEWRGDRYQVLVRDGALASFWVIELASEAAARELAAGLIRLADPARRVAREDRRVLVSHGLDADTFAAASTRVRQAHTWRAGGDPLATSAGRH
jgi:hypothetical protein